MDASTTAVVNIARISNAFALLLASVLYYNYPAQDPNLRPINVPTSALNQSYDFVIVGAGTAGCVLANRLTENPSWNVLLLEAGGDENIFSDTPLLAVTLWNTSLNWGYYTVPQPRACRYNQGRCPWPRGRVMGGSSTLNAMVYVRGNRRDYDYWASLGNPGWTYNEVLPYFRLSEDNRNPQYQQDTQYHGVGGYMTVSNPNFRSPLAQAYIDGGQELGYQVVDINARQQTGFMPIQGTLRNGSRCSTSKAFLRPIRSRPNLNVAEGAFVTQIIFNGTQAIGVKFLRDGQSYTVYATKEVILSAGSLNTPQLLMLSGIGPADQLTANGIQVKANLPVGMNLQDHQGAPLWFRTSSHVAVTSSDIENITNIIAYAQPNGQGPYTLPAGLEAVSFHSSSYLDPTMDYPDFEVHWASWYPSFDNNDSLWSGLALILHPKSRGQLTLVSSDPTVPLLFNPNYYEEDTDLQVNIQGLQLVYNMSQTRAMQAFNSTLETRLYGLCNDLPLLTNEFYSCVAQSYTTTIFHPVGTAMMGPSSNPNAVVSPRLQVHGFSALRVIDASIMPTVTGGNTNAPVIMIAERGADIIKADYGFPTQIQQQQGSSPIGPELMTAAAMTSKAMTEKALKTTMQ